MANAAFTGIFTSLEIEGNTYVDTGILYNHPIDLLDHCDAKMGNYVNKRALNKS
jgi:NTE family protein